MQSGQLLLWVIRVFYGAVIIGVAMAAFNSVMLAYPNNPAQAWAVFLGVLGGGLLIVLADIWITNKQITTLSALYFGLLLGLLLGYILSMALEPFVFDVAGTPQGGANQDVLRRGLQLVITVACCYVCDFHPAADQGRIPLHHPLRGILQTDQGRPGRWSSIPALSSTAGLPIFVIRGSSTPS